jgi:dienelactone hydrolase
VIRRWAAALAVVLAAAACTGDDPNTPVRMTISPPGQFDEPVDVSLSGLPGGASTTVTASATDAKGVRWSAGATYRADALGEVSLSQPPVSGDYSRADPMGLVESLVPSTGDEAFFATPPTGNYDITLTAAANGKTVATGTVHRLRPGDAGVTATQLRPATDGVYGVAYQPKDTRTKRLAVLVFGGSEGGLNYSVVTQAAALAAQGLPTLALAYFQEPGLPGRLDRIPLEYFTKALSILRARPGVDPHRVYVLGASRGGEAALLLGASFPDQVQGVVAMVPASAVHGAFPVNGHSGWTLRGREVPFTNLFRLPADEVEPATVIPVERIHGPVLLTCGGLDKIWPSCNNVDDIDARLTAHHFRYPVTVRQYDDSGHFATSLPPYANYTVAALDTTGGSVEGTQASNVDFRNQLLTFLGS